MTAMIKAERLTKIYQRYTSRWERIKALASFGKISCASEFAALREVSFEIDAGDSVAVIGKNGAGKSTLLKVLTGLSPPTAGSLVINGKVGALLQLGAGFHQDYTGAENIFIGGCLLGLTRSEIRTKFEEIVAFAELGEFIHQPVKSYSAGMQARLAFSINTAITPEVLLIDEVLAVGDSYFVSKCIRYLQDLMRGGCTVLLVSHDLSLVRQLCRKAMWLHDGRLMQYGAVAEVCSMYEMWIREEENKEILRRSRQLKHFRSNARAADPGGLRLDAPGPDQIRITDVQVLDAQEQERACFLIGDRLVIRLHYVSTIEYMNPNVGITIERADGLIVCASTLLDDGCEIGLICPGAGWVDAIYDPLFLGPGLYRITVSITLCDPLALGDTNFDRLSHCREFKVEARGRTYNVAVAHPVSWSHIQKNR
ncbi:MAG TPA: ABC transporter ATP-binding protein [Nitrospiraceae bacterium]|jgi:ABC-type polysaccharide/polyol phosphate transport system ATPase subunit|nr:ABC transporter ATP-binding protein [Nitrospiraceae bacterium]